MTQNSAFPSFQGVNNGAILRPLGGASCLAKASCRLWPKARGEDLLRDQPLPCLSVVGWSSTNPPNLVAVQACPGHPIGSRVGIFHPHLIGILMGAFLLPFYCSPVDCVIGFGQVSSQLLPGWQEPVGIYNMWLGEHHFAPLGCAAKGG